jgi:hypothetical protein
MANLTSNTQVFPVSSTWRSQTNSHGIALGTKAFASGGREYRFVKAGAAIAAKDAVRFGLSATGWDDVRPTSALEQVVVGAADGTAFDSGDYGFILSRGYSTVLATDSITAGVAVASSATAGLLIAQTAAHYGGRAGVVLVTAANADTDGATIYIEGV